MELCAANPGFASGTELSNIKILTDGGEHMEGCYLHNPATPPGRAEPGKASSRPRARASRGVLLPPSPEITCLSPTPPGSVGARVWGGRAFRKTIRIDRAVLYLLQSTAVKKLETQGQREAEGTLSGRPGRSPPGSGGTREWNVRNLHPSFFGSD